MMNEFVERRKTIELDMPSANGLYWMKTGVLLAIKALVKTKKVLDLANAETRSTIYMREAIESLQILHDSICQVQEVTMQERQGWAQEQARITRLQAETNITSAAPEPDAPDDPTD